MRFNSIGFWSSIFSIAPLEDLVKEIEGKTEGGDKERKSLGKNFRGNVNSHNGRMTSGEEHEIKMKKYYQMKAENKYSLFRD